MEAHIIDFNKNIYGQTLRLYLVKNIRKERKFSGIDELVKQIAQDKAEAYQILLKSGMVLQFKRHMLKFTLLLKTAQTVEQQDHKPVIINSSRNP